MGTLRMNTKEAKLLIGDNPQLQRKIDNLITKYAKINAKRYLDVFKQLYERGVIRWWNKFSHKRRPNSYGRLLSSIDYNYKIKQETIRNGKKSNKAIIIELHGMVNKDKYIECARRQIDKWDDEYNAGLNSGYIVDLMYSKGIMGLPEYWTRPNPLFNQVEGKARYENPVFQQDIPLYEFLAVRSNAVRGGLVKMGYIKHEFTRAINNPSKYGIK